MRRLITSIVAIPLMIIVCAEPAHADEWADLDDGDIQFGVESDPSGPTSDGTGDDGGTDGGTGNVTDGGPDGGSDDFLCVGPNGEVWDAGDSNACGGTLQDGPGQGQEQPPPPPVNPADLGGQVLDTMLIPSPQVSISPGPPNPTYVNLWTWFWVPDRQWVSHSQSISLRGTTVTVTIEPVRTTWDTGESTVTCNGPGEAWSAGAGERSSCGFEYSSTGSVMVSASIGWRASWTCSGVCIADGGDFGVVESEPSSARLQVRQRQSLVIN